MTSLYDQPVLMSTRIGSHLYGTTHAESDVDTFMVVFPTQEQVLMGRANASLHDPKSPQGDIQAHTVQRFLRMVQDGEGLAMDAVFAPLAQHFVPFHPLYQRVLDLRPQLIGPSIHGMIAFSERQLRLAGVDGSNTGPAARVKMLTEMLDAVQGVKADRVRDLVPNILPVAALYPEMVSASPTLHLKGIGDFVTVLGRKTEHTHKAIDFVRSLEGLLKRYGQRARVASGETNGVDLSYLAHAYRLSGQALEYFETGSIAFPRPDAQAILAIRMGQTPVVDALLATQERLVAVQAFVRPAADEAVMEEVVLEMHRYVMEHPKMFHAA